uniref:Uncharacterized protein n=1 Tax=Lycosa singoriensis TaxID=434756 RepID=A9QQ46_LYCSI|nr:hypothetical protein [Lycosa singoriensis]
MFAILLHITLFTIFVVILKVLKHAQCVYLKMLHITQPKLYMYFFFIKIHLYCQFIREGSCFEASVYLFTRLYIIQMVIKFHIVNHKLLKNFIC